MINVTVKTLDSQNHAFSVEDEITIVEFKEKIADTVNIPAETQRLIYCGRVLQDSSQLKDYDVDGKVVHLVQRPPPSSVVHGETPEPQPQPQRRVRGLEYVGTVRLPVSGIENTLHSLPIHSLANSRLNVARRMISRAETVLNALEHPDRQEQPVQNEAQEEATPIFEARVVIPPNATVFNATDQEFSSSTPVDSLSPLQEALNTEDIDTMIEPLTNGGNNIHSVSSTPEVITPLARSTENLAAVDSEQNNAPVENATTTDNGEIGTNDTTNNSAPTSQNPPGNISHTAEFADILDSLNRVHSRFAPFMEQYNSFMRDDPVVQEENARSTQAMINRVSEVCHYLGHAYHSVSDIILRVRSTPPRQLLCRPMLIQHSAVVQVDIPIQVEAQINIPSDRSSSTPSTATTGASTTSSTTSSTPTTATTVVSSASSDMPLRTLLGFPYIPRSGVTVETYRLPLFEGNNLLRNNNNAMATSLRAGLNPASDAYIAAIRSIESRTRPSPNTTTTIASTMPASGEQGLVQSVDVASAIASTVVNRLNNVAAEESGAPTSINVGGTNDQGATNNPNMEIFMEVTPESITIDSLETAFVAPNQANDINAILQESINPPSPEFIQSIMQMAGQLINRSNMGNIQVSTTSTVTPGVSTSTPTPSAPPLDATTSTTLEASVATSVGAARTVPFQNSQARGNTQTQPTTATHTRSTPRPHVHLAQHTVHAFDPFLPCNSHHVLRRRLHNANNGTSHQINASQNLPQTNQGIPNDLNNAAPPVYNIIQNLLSSIRNAYSNSLPAPNTQRIPSETTGNANNTEANIIATGDLMNAATNWMSNVPEGNYINRRPTVARILQQFPDNSYVPGESIFTDLIVLLTRGFTISDIMQVISGSLEPLSRITSELRTFVLCHILEGNTSDSGYERAVEKLLGEMRLFIDHLALLDTRDNIDVVRSVQALLRARLPNIVGLAVSCNTSSPRLMFEQIRTTFQQLGALIVRASQNGSDGVQIVYEAFLMQFMEGIPQELQQWSLQTTRPLLIEFIRNLDVPESLLQRYIVRHVDPVITPSGTAENHTHTPEPEPMQVEDIVENSTSIDAEITPALHLSDDGEAVPTVVLGSAPWHAQVPSDWVPIIVRDTQRQRRQNSQTPFSDAYLSGMPSKRRKLADCNKPPSSISQVISESVRRAVTATGLAHVAPIETVTQAAAADVNIQSAYRDLLHNNVQSRLERNEDFTPEQFPNVDSYFNNQPQ